jgi:hypothetical protein
MERTVKRLREEPSDMPPDESSIVDDIPNLPVPEVAARHRPTGPKPGKETPAGWRR